MRAVQKLFASCPGQVTPQKALGVLRVQIYHFLKNTFTPLETNNVNFCQLKEETAIFTPGKFVHALFTKMDMVSCNQDKCVV